MPQSKEQKAAYMKEYMKEYREENKEQIAAYKKEYYEENKEQIAAWNKEYREKNKEQIAAYMKEYMKEYIITPTIRRKWRYGISSEDYDAMLEEQDNKCKICLGEFNDQTVTNIDHCHTTNKVRGILCPHCNRGLGQFKEDIKVLTKAINYLEEHNEPIK